MAIDGGLRAEMQAGVQLLARYKGQEHTAEVVAAEDGKVRYRLADGREFKSPSAAGSAVMGGVACNGWRFWSVATDEAPAKPAAKKGGTKPKAGAKTKAAAKKASTGTKARAGKAKVPGAPATDDEAPSA